VNEIAFLERAFDEAMLAIYTRARKECNYNAHLYFDMLQRHGGLETARRLLLTNEDVQYGFTELWLMDRLNLTVEYLVLQRKWKVLISDEQRQVAKSRLLAHNFPEAELPN
jgi:hypothetical protein